MVTLEYWHVAILLVVFAFGLRSQYKLGRRNGTNEGVEATLVVLAAQGIIEYDGETIVGLNDVSKKKNF